LVGGYPPYRNKSDGNSRSEQSHKPLQNANIMEGRFEFHSKYWSHISSQAKALICSLLTVDANERLTCEQALEHEWIQCQGSTDDNVHLAKCVKQIRKYVLKNKNRGHERCDDEFAFMK